MASRRVQRIKCAPRSTSTASTTSQPDHAITPAAGQPISTKNDPESTNTVPASAAASTRRRSALAAR